MLSQIQFPPIPDKIIICRVSDIQCVFLVVFLISEEFWISVKVWLFTDFWHGRIQNFRSPGQIILGPQFFFCSDPPLPLLLQNE